MGLLHLACFFFLSTQIDAEAVKANVLVVYASDPPGQMKQLATAVAEGAQSTGANIRLLDVVQANYKRDVYEWADAIILGSGVYNGNAAPSVLTFVNGFDFQDRFLNKVGGAFATGGGAAAGLEPVLDELTRSLRTFGVVTVGGARWQNAHGTGAVVNGDEPIASDSQDLTFAKDQGARTAELALRLKQCTPSPTPTPAVSTFPAAWKATTHSNLTQPGFFAGEVIVDFAVDCTAGPSKQKMYTQYPDHYTVITRCDLGWQYIIAPASRGLSCEIWPVKSATCSQCGCPFCIQNNGTTWQKEIQWEGSSKVATSKITGQTVQVWHGKQVVGDAAQVMPMQFAVSSDSKPVSMIVNSSQWISSVTWFENFKEGVDADEFEPPASVTCPPIPVQQYPYHPVTDLDRDLPATVGSEGSSMSATPPAFPAQFKTSVITNISQPGYDGGNVFINFTLDCSKGPSTQISRTIFGNFHGVQLNCSSGLVHAWNKPPGAPEAFDCEIKGKLGQDFPLDVCNTCGLPFSVGSTGGVYSTSNDASSKFVWTGPAGHFTGVETTASTKFVMDTYPVNLDIPRGKGTETPQQFLADLTGTYGQIVNQEGWQRTMVHVSPLSTDVTAEDFQLPSCFKALNAQHDDIVV